ncbi:MAG: tRNA pseudouridine(38-40) synthase TruA [Candidatus Omnitrophota bacterium]|nr:tRNA pseudouridine(38-40) synthase TruA [Candidatus Omnitrophota bacterium]
MRNIKLVIEYDGTNYAGWQKQKNTRRTIQETIEAALAKILQEKMNLIASGRTDSGVHAFGQTANFNTNSKISPENIRKALNSLLPEDISISDAEDAPLGFHARFSAKSKTYRYLILSQDYPSALLRNYTYRFSYKLDLSKMRQATKILLGRHDFAAFCASGSSVKNTIKNISRITIKKVSYTLYASRYTLIAIDITADGFLYNMVRSIVGTLLEIGKRKAKPDVVREILRTRKRNLLGPTAPARGLCLLKVTY